ncbi:hypothetical protein [Streptantibioticus ferralitis]|uniref:Uncharacterized protein n=1 Tax=Streptantibioticus ferralitis TaxID=236510 RepID=A0ABT5Z447_9ACTN|nr:hypothetical protein [Streptantibioticus ferralitis]MDF2258569.1 hypothetical protein [Streptantibioticus ferralitis]
MKDQQRNRLDDRKAEQLLRCEAEDTTGVEELRTLSALLQAAATAPVVADDAPSAAGEDAAVAAFRTARAGVRQPGRRRMPGSFKVGIGAVAGALVFGGVAVAAQTGGLRLPFSGRQEPGPGGAGVSASAPARPSTAPMPGEVPDGNGRSSAAAGGPEGTGAPSSSGAAEPRDATQSLRGLCTAYRTARQSHGNPHPTGGLRRLVQAAGSEAAVADYCAELLGPDGTGDGRGGGKPEGGGKTTGNSQNGKAK